VRRRASQLLSSLPLLPLTLVLAPCAEAQFTKPQVELQGDRGPLVVEVEVARTQEEQVRGLMFRTELAAMSGMLFVYSYDARHSFWMKNTYIPLDMIHIAADMTVVGIVENAEPLTTTPRVVDAPARHVLEVNAGFCRLHGVKVGSQVVIRGVPEAEGP